MEKTKQQKQRDLDAIALTKLVKKNSYYGRSDLHVKLNDLSDKCFDVEDLLPLWGQTEQTEQEFQLSEVRRDLYKIRCTIGRLVERVKTQEVY